MSDVFEIPDWFSQFDERLSQVSISLLGLCLLIMLIMAGLDRFQKISFDEKLFSLIIYASAIPLWPLFISGSQSLISSFNNYLVKELSDGSWRNVNELFENLFSVKGDFEFGNIISLGVENITLWIGAIILLIGKYALHLLFLVLLFLYKVMGPLVLARGILSDDLSVLKKLCQEVVCLLLWQSMLVIVSLIFVKAFHRENAPEDIIFSIAKFITLGAALFSIPMLTRKFVLDISLPVGQAMMNRAQFVGGAGLTAAAVGGAIALNKANVSAARIGGEFLTNQHPKHFSGGGEEGGTFKRIIGNQVSKAAETLKSVVDKDEAKKNGIDVPSMKEKALARLENNPHKNQSIRQREAAFEKFKAGQTTGFSNQPSNHSSSFFNSGAYSNTRQPNYSSLTTAIEPNLTALKHSDLTQDLQKYGGHHLSFEDATGAIEQKLHSKNADYVKTYGSFYDPSGKRKVSEKRLQALMALQKSRKEKKL